MCVCVCLYVCVCLSVRVRVYSWAYSETSKCQSVYLYLMGARRMAAIRLALVLWEVMLVMFSTYDKRSSPEGSGRGRRGSVREGYKVVAFLLKPSLGLFGLVGRRRVLLTYPGSATGHLIAPGDHYTLQLIQLHFVVDFQANFDYVRRHDVALILNHTKDHDRPGNFVFITLGTSLSFMAIQICILRVLAMVLLS